MPQTDQITYEQCPFAWDHIAQLYQTIREEPPNDEQWIPLATGGPNEVWYRRSSDYFQLLAGNPNSPLLEAAKALSPMLTNDDAEWEIAQYGDEGYAVRSNFARTYGPVTEQGLLDELLAPHGLWIESCDSHVRGAATFETLDPTTLLAACRRLATLEAWFMAVNREIERYLDQKWQSVRLQIAENLQTHGPEFLTLVTDGGKRREPIPQIARDLI